MLQFFWDKLYVYALNIKEKEITAALSFQDKETAKRAYEAAFRGMEEKKHHTYGFHFGYTEEGLQISSVPTFFVKNVVTF